MLNQPNYPDKWNARNFISQPEKTCKKKNTNHATNTNKKYQVRFFYVVTNYIDKRYHRPKQDENENASVDWLLWKSPITHGKNFVL